jgi:hypothetical protein
MARSSARRIFYDLRPSKQSERRIMMDVLRAAGESGLPMANYRYVGMGAVRFYDFLLVHRYLGINQMVSLEHDHGMFLRAQFNRPYEFIDVRNQTTSAFISADPFDLPTIIWFDYDGGLGPHIAEDVSSAGVKLKQGDFFFVTVNGHPPRAIDRQRTADRLVWLQDTLGDLSGDVRLSDVEDSSFAIAVHKVLLAAFKNAFASRRDGSFKVVLQVEYTDTSNIVTVGGAFLPDGLAITFVERLTKQLPFLGRGDDTLYEIVALPITEQERALFDRAATKRGRSAERNAFSNGSRAAAR